MISSAAPVALLAALVLASATPPELTPLEAATLDRVRAALPQRTVPALSAPLVQAARVLARSAAGGEPRPVSSSALRAALAAAGVVDPAPAAIVLSARPATLPEAMAAAARFRGATHLGIGVVARGDLSWAVLLASERRAEIDPFPREVPLGSRAVLSGRLLDLDGPRVWVASPSGTAFEVPVESDGRRFSASLLLSERGIWRVEVGGTGARGPSMAALLDVACGEGGAPASPEAEPDPSSRSDAETRIRADVNVLRARQGLPPLQGAAALDEQARRHSEAMLAAGTVAHRLAGGGDVATRLAASGVRYRSARENVARGDGALDAHRAMVESPAHLANLIVPEVKLLGLGIARGVLPGGQPVVYLTEILVEPRAPLPAGDPPTGAR
jgi:uncharacterized protein YkwD